MSFRLLTRVLVSAGATLILVAQAQANSRSESSTLRDRNVRVLNAGKTTGAIPQGMVLVEGGRFNMGVSPKQMDKLVEKLGVEDGENVGAMPIISGWYPDFQVEVGDLLVDQYEYTNLQYQMYLEARRQDPTKDLLDWHWYSYNSKGEKVPGLTEAKHDLPVRAITGKDAERAALWVGKRLPTETEWEYFARKGLSEDQYYPWADKGLAGWETSKCSNSSTSMTREGPETSKGGSFPEDQNLGIFDLCGNVTEWTSTPFLPHPGWKPYEVKVRRKKRTFRSEFSSEHWTIRGGNCRGSEISNVLVARQPWHPNSLAEYVGFRCVMSAVPGLDILRHAEARNLTLMQRDLKGMLDYSADGMAAQLSQEVDPSTNLIHDAQHLAFTRIKESTFRGEQVFLKASIEEPVAIGVFSTSKPVAYPDLPAGTYALYYKNAGLSKAQKEAQRAAEEAKKAEEAAEAERKKQERRNRGKSKSKKEREAEEEAAKKAAEEAAEEAAAKEEQEEPAEEEVKVKVLTLLDLPTDQDIILIKSEAEEIVAWLPAHRAKSKQHSTRFGYLEGGGDPDRTTTSASAMGMAGASTVAGAAAANDLAWFQFTIKIGSSNTMPQMNLKIEFEPGSFEAVTMPVEEKPAKGSRR